MLCFCFFSIYLSPIPGLLQSWDHGLARVAKAWAQRCLFEHNPEPDKEILAHSNVSVGENIWMGTPASAFSVQRAVESWVKERAHYDYQSNTCSHVCGHYTQVWLRRVNPLGAARNVWAHWLPSASSSFTFLIFTPL